MTKTSLMLGAWLVLLLAILTTGYEENKLSCERTNSTREGLRISFEGQARRAKQRAILDAGPVRTLDVQAQQSAWHAFAVERPLDCSELFPGTR